MKPHLTGIVLAVATLGCYAIEPTSGSKPAQSAIATIPFGQMKQWLHFTRADLDAIAVKTGQLDFSTRFAYEDDHSLRWQYKPGDTLTWNHKQDKLGRTPFFYFTAIEPKSQGGSPSSFRLEFLDGKGIVACHAELRLAFPFWNRCILRLSPTTSSGNGGRIEVGVTNLVGDIPSTVSAIRLTPLSGKSGEVFLGGWLLTAQPLFTPGNVAELNGFPELPRPDPQTLPNPVPAEIEAVETIGKQLERSVMADWLEGLRGGYAAFVPDVRARYQALNLRRTGEGLAGRNLFMEEIRKNPDLPEKLRVARYEGQKRFALTGHSWDNGGESYCLLMFDIAQCYRHEAAPARRAEFLDMYQTLFDFSQYLKGFSSPWANGNGFVDSVFLMRKELADTRRVDDRLLELLRRQIDFGRIFLARSVFNTAHPGDLGEDCDYTRLTSERLIQLSLLEPDPKIRVYDLHAFQRWFGRIVLAYAPGVRDTFKPDGSLNHHGGLIFGYGAGALATGSRVISLFAKTPFAIEPAGHAFFKKALMLRRNFSRNGLDPLILSGKEALTGGTVLKTDPYRLMALAGTPDGTQPVDRDMAAVYLRLFDEKKEKPTDFDEAARKLFEKEKILPDPIPQGNFTLGWSAAAIHRQEDWLLCVRGYSRYAYSRESGHMGCDHFVNPHLGFGTVELLDKSNYKPRYRSFVHETDLGAAGFDWTKFPGTTDVALPYEKLVWQGDWRHHSDQPFVGGVDAPNGSGVFVLSLHGPKKVGLDSFHAEKSWFFFGDTVVCLGSGIQSAVPGCETTTTLIQDAWRQPNGKGNTTTPVFLNDAVGLNAFPLDKKGATTSAPWLLNRQNVGFYLYPGQQLVIRRGEQTSPDSFNKKQTVGKFTTVWLSHGVAPKHASYRYLMKIGTTPESMAALAGRMAKDAPYKILRQDDAAHIVLSKVDATTGYVVFKAYTATTTSEVTAVSRPCVLVTHRAGAGMTLSVADPDLNLVDNDKPDVELLGYSQSSTIVITLHGRWETAADSTVAVTYPEPGKTAIAIACQNGLTSSLELIPNPN